MFEDLYRTPSGRMLARLLAAPFLSRAAGAFMDSRLSRPFIRRFARSNRIDLSEAAAADFGSYRSFNDFFTRRLRPGARPLQGGQNTLVSPCDGLLSVFPISPVSRFEIKGSAYTLQDLLQDGEAAQTFQGGLCLVFRLTPSHYHRYTFPCDGEILQTRRIPGIYHTVRPGALEKVKVFRTNTREWALLKTDFGLICQMEVGAMLVGRIANAKTRGAFTKGDEKGFFEFGGSTIVLLMQKDALDLDSRWQTPNEMPIRAGEALGEKMRIVRSDASETEAASPGPE